MSIAKRPYPKYIPPQIQNRLYIPERTVDEGKIKKLFSISLDADLQKLISFMSEENISLNVKNPETGETLLHAILRNEALTEKTIYNYIVFLIKNNVSVSAFDKNNVTALHLAAKNHYLDIVKLLLKNGADPNAQDSQKMTPLHYASQGNIIPCIKPKKTSEIIEKKSDTIETEDLKNLTRIVIQILGSKYFKQYIDHINETFVAVGEIFDLESKKNQFIVNIHNIVSSYKDKNETVQQIENQTLNQVSTLNEDIIKEIGSGLREFNIGFNEMDVTKNITNDDYGLFIKSDPPKSQIQIMKTKLEGEKVNILSEILKHSEYIEGEKNRVNKDLIPRLYSIIHEIIQMNAAALANRKFASGMNIGIPGLGEKYILGSSTDALFPINEISTKGQITIDEDKHLPPNDLTFVKARRVNKTADNAKDYEKNNKEVVLTNDTFNKEPLIGPNPEKQFGDLWKRALSSPFLYPPSKDGDTRYYLAGDQKIPFYFISKMVYFLQRSIVNFESFKESTTKISEILKNDEYDVYELVSDAYTTCFDIITNLQVVDIELGNIKIQAKNLKVEFQTNYNQFKDHPYSFLIQHCIDKIGAFIREIDGIKTKVYTKQCVDFVNFLNRVISLVNKSSAFEYIQVYEKPEFIKIEINRMNYSFDRTLRKLKIPSVSQQERDIENARYKFFENYTPTIDEMYYPIYRAQNKLSQKSKMQDDREKEGINTWEPRAGLLFSGLRDLNKTLIPIDVKVKLSYNGQGNSKLEGAILGDNEKLKYIGWPGYENPQSDMMKSGKPYGSIQSLIDKHLEFVRYHLISHIITAFVDPNHQPGANQYLINDEKVRNDITKLKGKINIGNKKFDEFTKYIPEIAMLTRIGRIADKIIINHIKFALQKGLNNYIQNELTNIGTPLTKGLLYTKSNTKEVVDDIIQNLQTDLTSNPKIENYRYNTRIMEKEDPIPNQYKIYYQNYGLDSPVVEEQCFKVDPDVIDVLIKAGSKINQKDVTLSSPIFYAIGTLNDYLTEQLINHGAAISIPTIKNVSQITPIEYAMSLIKNHNKTNTIKDTINIFSNYQKVKDRIQSNPDNKNNIVRYFDIIFPQLVVMYNNLLYAKTKEYTRGMTYQKFKAIVDLLIQYHVITANELRVPILQNVTKDMILKSTNIEPVQDMLTENDLQYQNKQRKIDDAQNMINSYQAELNDLPNIRNVDIDSRRGKLNELISKEREIIKLLKEHKDLSPKRSSLDTAINSGFSQLQRLINDFVNNKPRDVPKQYDDIIDQITEKKDLTNIVGTENYFLYNAMWKAFLDDESKMKTIYNIHLVVSLLIGQIMQQPVKSIQITELKTIQELYKNIFVPIIDDYTYVDVGTNYIFSDVLDIIIHIVTYVIMSNFFYAIDQHLIEYTYAIGQPDLKKKIIDNNNNKLKKYIITTIPKKIVDSILLISNDNLDTVFEEIINILISNTVLPITKDSEFIGNIRALIKYYRDVLEQTIPAMKQTIDNYNRFILNENRFLTMLIKLIEKAHQE